LGWEGTTLRSMIGQERIASDKNKKKKKKKKREEKKGKKKKKKKNIISFYEVKWGPRENCGKNSLYWWKMASGIVGFPKERRRCWVGSW